MVADGESGPLTYLSRCGVDQTAIRSGRHSNGWLILLSSEWPATRTCMYIILEHSENGLRLSA